MTDLHYEEPMLAAIYDFDNEWSIDGEFYLSLAGLTPCTILDLGCGTGLLSDALATLGHEVTGVDPAAAMLDIARQRPNGNRITWVQSTAQAFRSSHRFDLIVMTGNTFQVLLDDEAIRNTFTTMRCHLAANGRIAFETRNPAINWPVRWNRNKKFRMGETTIRQSRRVRDLDGNRIRFETHYAFPDRQFMSSSELLFLSKPEIEQRLSQSGLAAEAVYGDWDARAFDEAVSDTMIFIVKPKLV